MKIAFLAALVVSTMCFDISSQYIIAQMAMDDLTAHNKATLDQAQAMLEPLNELSGAGSHPFLDAAAWPTEIMSHGYNLADLWHFQNNPLFDGVEEHDVEIYDRFNLLNEITYSLFAVDAQANSRISKVFSKSYMLRYTMNLIAEVHSPMHNINLFNAKHKAGDEHGVDFKLTGTHKNLYDLWENSFGMFETHSYPISSDKEVQAHAAEIMAEYSREDLASDLKDDSKKGWSDASYDIAKDLAYTAIEGKTPEADYIEQGKAAIRRQMALAAYRVADQLVYCMSKQE